MNSPLSTEQLFGIEPFRKILPNGLTVLFAPENNAGLVSVQVWVKTGSIHEGDLLGSGISHYVEHMVFKGTRHYSCREISKLVQSAGASINAYTTFDRTVYHIDGPAECAELAFDVLSEMMFRANLSPADAVRERSVILREIDMRDDDPDSLFSEAVLADAFHEHPYRLPVIGLRDAFSQLGHKQLQAYYKARYVPNNMVLAVAGAIAPGEVFRLAEEHFGKQPAAAIGIPCVPPEPEQLAPRRGALHADTQVLRGSMVWRIPGMRHPDAPALDIFSMLLGFGESSRLNCKLHNELGIVHEIDASNWAPGATGLLWLSYIADPGKRAEVEEAVLSVIKGVLDEGFFETEFAKARRACLMSFLNARKTVSGIASQLGAQSVVIGDPGYPRLYLERVGALTPLEVLEAARRHIRPDTLTCYAMEPRTAEAEARAAAAEAAASAGPVPFEEVRLENGLRVLLQPVRGYPKVSFRILFPGGGRCEPANRRGLCAILATLLTRDTENRTAAEVAETAETLGASLHETDGNNSFGLAIEVLPGDAEAATEILADAVLHPALCEKTFLAERDAQRSALQENEDDVVEYGKRRLREIFFGEHPLSVDSLGRKEDLAAITPADVRALHAWLARPENAVLAVSGDFDRDAVLADLKAKFGHWHSGSSAKGSNRHAPDLLSPAAVVPPARTGRVSETQPHSQAVVFWAFPDAGIVDDDFVPGQLLEELLSGIASQLFISVREERGMAYFVGAERLSALREGMFFLCAGTIPSHVEAVLEAMRRELIRVREKKISNEEIISAKARLRAAKRIQAQTIGARTMEAALLTLYGIGANSDEHWEKMLDKQDADTLAVFAEKYLRDDKGLIYTVLPQKK
ncbi:MAG: insulinase family protein [Puniceicoccales bacterium]|jgi:zinc protease|nr:insulinase family protein [Puniceicoccales bacterium]